MVALCTNLHEDDCAVRMFCVGSPLGSAVLCIMSCVELQSREQHYTAMYYITLTALKYAVPSFISDSKNLLILERNSHISLAHFAPK